MVIIRSKTYWDFWNETQKTFQTMGAVERYAKFSPSGDNWVRITTGTSGIYYAMGFTKNKVRVQLELDAALPETNKARYDYLYTRHGKIESAFGDSLSWNRMAEKRMSKIVYATDIPDGHERENWPTMIQWLARHIQKLAVAFDSKIPILRSL